MKVRDPRMNVYLTDDSWQADDAIARCNFEALVNADPIDHT
jgi:hypothetical protein